MADRQKRQETSPASMRDSRTGNAKVRKVVYPRYCGEAAFSILMRVAIRLVVRRGAAPHTEPFCHGFHSGRVEDRCMHYD